MNKISKVFVFFVLTCLVVYLFYFTVPSELRLLYNNVGSLKYRIFLFETLGILTLFFTWLSARKFLSRYIVLFLTFAGTGMINWLAWKYNIFFSDVFAADVWLTTRQEASGFVNSQFILYCITYCLLILLLAFVIGKFKLELFNFRNTRIKRAANIIFFILFSFSWLANCYPIRTYYVAFKKFYWAKVHLIEILPKLRALENKDEPSVLTKPLSKDSFVFFHVGESLRGDHTPMLGYERNTMPRMLQEFQKGNLFVFKRTISFATGTRFSLVGMMTPISITDPIIRHSSFIPFLHKHDIKLSSFFSSFNPYSNASKNDIAISVFVTDIDDHYINNGIAHLLLPQIKDFFSSLKTPDNRFAIYAGDGSHLPFREYDKERFSVFMPVNFNCDANETTTNAYDNTIVYTDYFMGEIIDEMRARNSVYIYASDHGEVIGEDGSWGRSGGGDFNNITVLKNKALHDVLFFIWVSDSFKRENRQKYLALKENSAKLAAVSHDYLYHTVLGLYNIKNDIYDKELDVFSKDAKPFVGPMPEEMNPMTFITKLNFEE